MLVSQKLKILPHGCLFPSAITKGKDLVAVSEELNMRSSLKAWKPTDLLLTESVCVMDLQPVQGAFCHCLTKG